MVIGIETLVVERRSAGVSNDWRESVPAVRPVPGGAGLGAGLLVFQTRTET